MKGVITTFLPEKGYGFIKGADGRDYYFRESAFGNVADRKLITEMAGVEFEQVASPKGYKAKNCILISNEEVKTYYVPSDCPTSKTGTLRGWDIIEYGDWVIHSSERESPEAARKMLFYYANRVKANALVDVEYYKTQGEEPGTGRGTHYYTIHNFSGRMVTAARKSVDGTYRLEELYGLNQRASAEKERLSKLTVQSTKQRNRKLVVLGLTWGTAFLLAIACGAGVFVDVFLLFILIFFASVVSSQAINHDGRLQYSKANVLSRRNDQSE